jgi:hypothetical protein
MEPAALEGAMTKAKSAASLASDKRLGLSNALENDRNRPAAARGGGPYGNVGKRELWKTPKQRRGFSFS